MSFYDWFPFEVEFKNFLQEPNSFISFPASSSPLSSAADSYIGYLVSLTSKSEIRYEGILYNFNARNSSIALRSVRSFGTEGRKKDGPQIPPGDKVYEYILFRRTDIKDLQVKSSPPVRPARQVRLPGSNFQGPLPLYQPGGNIRSWRASPPVPNAYGGGIAMPMLELPGSNFQGPLPLYQPGGNIRSWRASPPVPNAYGGGIAMPMLGLPGSNFQGPLPLYQPGGNIRSWRASPPVPNAYGGGIAMPMYWQGYYGAPFGLPQLHQQSLLRPPPGLSMASSMQQPMRYPNFSPSLPTVSSNLPPAPPALSPAPALSSRPSVTPPSEVLPVTVTNKTPNVSASLPSLIPLTSCGSDINALVPPISSKLDAVSGSSLPHQAVSQLSPAILGSLNSIRTETPAPTLVTPGQLLQSGPTIVSSAQPPQTPHKDGEMAQVSSPEPSLPVSAETKPPILPSPVTSGPSLKPGGAPIQTRHGYSYRGRGRGRGRGIWRWRPVTRFTEDFDIMAMNEKVKKDGVWGQLGKTNKFHSKEDNDDLSNVKPYNKDDFFDSLSSSVHDNSSESGRTRYFEQIKIDTETFGDFVMYCGGRGGHGPGCGGRTLGGYYGRGGGYGYNGRGKGCSMPNRRS